jgi:hypothetical protein
MFEALISNKYLILSLSFSLVLIVLSDRILNVFEKLWENVSDRLYDPVVDAGDPFDFLQDLIKM